MATPARELGYGDVEVYSEESLGVELAPMARSARQNVASCPVLLSCFMTPSMTQALASLWNSLSKNVDS